MRIIDELKKNYKRKTPVYPTVKAGERILKQLPKEIDKLQDERNRKALKRGL